MSLTQNITRIKAVHHALEELADKVVFLGGATVALYADRSFSEARPTDDVDMIVEVVSYTDYAQIEEQLRGKGFINNITSGVICRYIIQGIIVDVMPSIDKVLGFGNRWYTEAFTNAMAVELDERISVKIFSPVYFMAAKLEAYKDRGGNDGRTSTDFEDIVFLLNKRSTIWDELQTAPFHVKEHLIKIWRLLLKEPHLEEWISCHLDFEEQRRVNYIMAGLHSFTEQ